MIDDVVPSTSATEATVMSIWTEVLQSSEAVSLESDFFKLGGDSLTMMMVLFRIAEELQIELAPAALLDAPTPGQLAAVIEARRGTGCV